jgi:hypothetical protein
MPEMGFTMNNILIFGDIIKCYLWLELPVRELLLELLVRELLELPDRLELPLVVDDDLLLGVDDVLLFVLPELLPERFELL